ncbi:hypothetical protein [Pseudoalteromonas sp.]|uniref:hypothetical protein n=1 Tax=Pseudoalteromonas sp. TaxID=53249 RepID=UPI00344FFB9E
MFDCNVIAIDLAKNLFQVCKTDKNGNVIYNKAITRAKLKELLIKEKQSLVAMESCGGTHYWARFAKQAGQRFVKDKKQMLMMRWLFLLPLASLILKKADYFQCRSNACKALNVCVIYWSNKK